MKSTLLRSIAALFLALFVLNSCEKEESQQETHGDLNVIVTLNGSELLENAEVYTEPATKEGTTDEFGSVLFRNIEAGTYEVFARVPNTGIGRTPVKIIENELNETSVNVRKDVYEGLAPTINIISPQENEFTGNDTITFEAIIQDHETPPEEISVKWESNLDGVINSDSPNENGEVSFSTHSLSQGEHEITVTAEDTDGYIISSKLQVSTLAATAVTLYEPSVDDGKVIIEWTAYPHSDFLKYEVIRSDDNCSPYYEEVLISITDKNITQYTDETPPLDFQACYHIRVTNKHERSATSSNYVVDLPSEMVFNFVPYDMLKHPTEPFVYLLDQGGQRILQFDYQSMQVVDEVTLPGTIGYGDIADNGFGVEVYIPCNDGSIYIFDAENLEQTATIYTGLQTKSVVANSQGHVIASVAPDPWFDQPVRTYSRASGINIDGGGDHDRDRLRKIPGKNEYISISTGISPRDMEFFRLTDEGTIDLHQDDQYHSEYPLNANIFRVSDDGTYVITSSYGAVYIANSSMEYRGELQRGTLHFSDFAFSEDGSTIYAATSNRKSIQIGHYPSLIRDDEILTKGYPVMIVRDGNQIISLSKPREDSTVSGIEIIDM